MKSLFVCLLLLTSHQAFAFGSAHVTIANEAWERLGPTARGRLQAIFNIPTSQTGTACPMKNAADAGKWLDCVRSEGTLAFFKDIEHSEALPVCPNDPAGGKCVTNNNDNCPSRQIQASIDYLKSTKSLGATVTRLYHTGVLFHLIGDIHQPQHAGNTHNARYLYAKLPTKTVEFHHAWDQDLVKMAEDYYGDAEVDRRISMHPEWRSGTQFDWISNNAQASKQHVYDSALLGVNVCSLNTTTNPPTTPPTPPYLVTLSPAYIEMARDLEIRQIGKAAIRLEMTLEDVF